MCVESEAEYFLVKCSVTVADFLPFLSQHSELGKNLGVVGASWRDWVVRGEW